MNNECLRFICFLLLLFNFSSTFSQEDEIPISYIPDEVVKIRINFVLLNNDKGEGGWDQENSDHMHVLNSAIGWMNGSLAYNAPINNPDCYGKGKCYPKRSSENYKYIKDTKVRFELGEVLTYDSTKYWHNWDCNDFQDSKEKPECPEDNLQYRCPNDEYKGNWYLNPLSQAINQNPDILPAINVFFTEDGEEYIPFIVNKECSSPRGRFHVQNCSEAPNKSLDKESRVHMRSQFLKYSQLINCRVCEDESLGECQFDGTPEWCCIKRKMTDNIIDGLSRTLMHELGHSIVFTAGHCSLCPGEGLMHASNHGKTLHSVEIEHAHEKIIKSNLIRYVISEKPITIEHSDQNWERFLNLHKDYVIKNDKTLTIKSDVNLLSGNNLIVENGNLILAAESSMSIGEDSKIVVKDGSSLIIKSAANIDFAIDGKIEIECGGKLTIEDHVSINYTSDQRNFHFSCNELIGSRNIERSNTSYSLPFSIPEGFVNWSVSPEEYVSYTTNGNSITVQALNLKEGKLLVKASFNPPYQDLTATKVVWVGDNHPFKNYIEIAKELMLFQIEQLNQHIGF